MMTIQEAGQQILLNNPLKFYAMCGPEYGIKLMYIKQMESHYGRCVNADSVSSLFKKMRIKSIIPEPPAVYVVRYDDEFISSLNDHTVKTIDSLSIKGTIVCIYDQPKHAQKLDKFLSKYTVSIDHVDDRYLIKYLKKDFKELPDIFLQVATECSTDYNQATLLCQAMLAIPKNKWNSLSKAELKHFFNKDNASSEEQIRLGVAAKDVAFLFQVLDRYDGEPDEILYCILSTMVTLEGILTNNKKNSDISKYASLWKTEDVYYMFMNTYNLLQLFRTNQPSDLMESIEQLISLLAFTSIPSPEVLK